MLSVHGWSTNKHVWYDKPFNTFSYAQKWHWKSGCSYLHMHYSHTFFLHLHGHHEDIKGPESLWYESWEGQNIFSSPRHADWFWVPPSILLNGYHKGSFPGPKQLRRDVNHSSSSSVQVKNKWSHTCTPPIWLHCMDRENIIIIIID